MRDPVDYIIVGAGSAGCVLANQLSEDGRNSVLLVESGGTDDSALIDMPRGIGRLLTPGDPHCWWYEAKTGANSERVERWLTGRALGGSSSVNGMVYTRGHPEDYNEWERAGCTGWGWNDIGRCFVKMENHELGADRWRGAEGPLHISLQPSGNVLCEAMLQAAEQAGIPRVDDTNMAWDGGFGYQPRNIYRGRRQSSAKAFLRPALNRANLHVLTATDVLRVNFEGHRATGVALRDANGVRNVVARREVILAAGALHSPRLLQVSGIGPGQLLSSLGIPTLVDAPEVGRNLHDHRYLPAAFKVTTGSLNHQFAGLRLLGNLARYFLAGSGPMTHAAHEIAGFAKMRPDSSRPDCQIGGSLYTIEATEKGLAIGKEHGLTLGGYYMQPKSKGTVMITASNIDAPASIQANYLSAQEDQEGAVALVHFLRKLVAQPALAGMVKSETFPGPAVQTDEQIIETFLKFGSTTYHYAGTCRMGADATSVLDPQLRVRGVEGLRVADASIMPALVSGNTNAPSMAIGLRASELILAAQKVQPELVAES